MTMHDAIVIGAGHNGLAAAIHLAARGWKVAVVEQAAEPGGAVKTREVTLPGFRHDLCAMNLSMFAGSAFFAAWKDELIAHGLELVPAPDAFCSAFPDGSWLGVSASLDETASRISAISPRDADAWRRMVADFGAQAPHLFGLLGAEMPSPQTARTVWKAWRAMGTSGLLDIGRMLLSTPRDFLDAHFESDRLKAMMAAWGLHLDFAPDTAGGALFPYLESMASQAFGMVIGKGGADTIIRSMTALLRAKGGELLLGTAVDRIETDGGRATGVRLSDGKVLRANKAVIANAHPKLVFGKLLPSDPKRAAFDARIASFRAGPGTMMIHLALDRLPDWKAGPDLHRFAYVHLAPDMGLMARTYAEAAGGLLPREPVLVVGQPTAVDPSRAPEGKHVLWVQVRVLPADITGDAAGTITARTWDEAKDAYAERVLDLLETYAPGIRSHILGRSVFSPLDLERENPNLIGGDNLSGSHRLDQNFLFRPVAGWSRYRTPVEKLYLCGASTWPGAGTGAGSGFMLGRRLGGK
ncbi:phytoene desaturase family protein [Mesorhizobium sp. L-8-3]|uniref:phytoene desaturase family protein n=1 Tax=Mesorhizobium sp. L-8-3 TaxID=2744522 RepID=UPI0019287FE0|nr:NAD(P)/FAD-dependent oxidoreductase [Mesorhizobium sp. L-8-3]